MRIFRHINWYQIRWDPAVVIHIWSLIAWALHHKYIERKIYVLHNVFKVALVVLNKLKEYPQKLL